MSNVATQQVVLTPQEAERIRVETKQLWRPCKRKAYKIAACKLPAGYVYANSLEQPDCYKEIMRVYKRPIITKAEFDRMANRAMYTDKDFYVTSDAKITLCGTQGEMWEVRLDRFAQSYRMSNGAPINVPTLPRCRWFVVARAGGRGAVEVGICIPKTIVAKVVLSWGVLYMNSPKSKGHYKGDILVYPANPDGSPNFNESPSTINNCVFSLTMDQGTGGWGNSGLITPPEKAKANGYTLTQLNGFLTKAKLK